MGNIGLPYKSGLGSALRVGTISFLLTSGLGGDYSYTAKTFYQAQTPRISGISTTILANEPFIWTYRILPEAIPDFNDRNPWPLGGIGTAPTMVYRGDASSSGKLHMTYNFQNSRVSFFNFIVNENALGGITLTYATIEENFLVRNKVYNFTLYKNEGPFTAASSYRFYINGVFKSSLAFGYDGNTVRIPLNQLSGITFNDVYFGGQYQFFGAQTRTIPMYVFNNSVFKLDSGLTTTYIDNLVTELHRVENYVHLLSTSYTINPSNVVYYFPLYLKEGKDIKDYYNPSKKFFTEIGFGAVRTANFISTGSTNYLANQPTQSASIYKGPYNVWKKPYPPYDPYI